MSDDRHTPAGSAPGWTCDQVREELEAWALGALEPDDAAMVEHHLAGCEACHREADQLIEVVSMLPFALTPVEPSAETRRHLMSRIADDQMAGSVASAPLPPSGNGPSTGSMTAPPRQAHWSQMLIAPLAIALLVMTLWSFELRDQADDDDQDTVAVNDTTAMFPAGVQTFSLRPECEACQSAGKLLADPEKADALMVAWNLDPSQIHQVWCVEDNGSKVLVASLNVSDTGDVVQPLLFEQPLADYSHIYVMSRKEGKDETMMGVSNEQLSSPTPVPELER